MKELLRFYLVQMLKSPMIYAILLLSVVIFGIQAKGIPARMPATQNQYEQKLGFQDYAVFSKSNKEKFISERSKLKEIPIYVDNMNYKNRVKTIKLLANDPTLAQVKQMYEKLQDKKQIAKLKFVNTHDLSLINFNEFKKYQESMYIPYGLGYTIFTQTASTKNYDYSINLPYLKLIKMIYSKKEKVSAPIARYLVRVLTIFSSIGAALLTAWLFSSDLALSRLKTFRMANANLRGQLLARILGIIIPLIVGSLILTMPVFILLGKNIMLDYSIMDYLIYYFLSVPISVVFSAVISAILTIVSDNIVFGMLASFSLVAASSRTSAIQVVFPFGLKWFKYIPSVSDFTWNAKILVPYIEHQLVYLMVGSVLFIISERIWYKKNLNGKWL